MADVRHGRDGCRPPVAHDADWPIRRGVRRRRAADLPLLGADQGVRRGRAHGDRRCTGADRRRASGRIAAGRSRARGSKTAVERAGRCALDGGRLARQAVRAGARERRRPIRGSGGRPRIRCGARHGVARRARAAHVARPRARRARRPVRRSDGRRACGIERRARRARHADSELVAARHVLPGARGRAVAVRRRAAREVLRVRRTPYRRARRRHQQRTGQGERRDFEYGEQHGGLVQREARHP
ncbi:Uncharacterised protein [Burkholderia pseudomallei]|nr:Uncharacterised protein [Burkholderia pseudomallei]